MPVNHSTPKPLQVAAAVIGNALEWYDFIIFGFLTVVIARLFFPAESQYASLLLTTATFGVGFFMRPVGGILLGIYADRKGRKTALLLIIVLMTAAIAMIGFAPTYAAIGVAAPLIIVLARLLQGFATGGEFASATSFLIESAPAHRRGFYGSWQMVGQGLAVLVGALLGALLTRSLAAETLDSWGWRVPFLLGLVIGPVGLFIRRHLQETEAFLEARGAATVRQSFGTMLATHLKEVLVCMGIITSGTVSFYVILLYMPTFARTQLHLPLDQAFVAQSISLACMIVLTPVSGALSDRIGRKPIIIAALTLYFVFLWSNVDRSRRAVCDEGAFDRAWRRIQSGSHDFRRLRAVFRDLVDRGNRLTDSAVVLRDVRRGDWRCGGLLPRRSRPGCSPTDARNCYPRTRTA